jgi:HK97 family phage major capsid protein/HK97 family phage prohead protease
MDDLRKKQTAAPPPNGDPLEFVMSDDSVDRMGDVIEADGWQLDNFRKNPVALFGHNPSFPIGKWSEVTIRGNQLVGRLALIEPVSDRMREVHAAVDAGVLRAVSVGFHPSKFEPIKDSKIGGMRFIEQELVECSLVSVPANPNALALAKSLGISPQGQQLIFGVSADGDQAPHRRGFRGVSAPSVPRKSQSPMNQLSERIQTAQAELVSLQDKLAGTDDLAETKDFTDRIEEIKEQIAIYSRAEKALGSESEPIAATAAPRTSAIPQVAARPPKAWAMPKKKDEDPGYLFIRHCAIKTVARATFKPDDQVALQLYGQNADWEITKGVHEWYMRAATAPATTTTTGWAAELATTMYGDYIESLMPGGIYGPLSGRGFRATLGRYAQISMPTRAATPTVAGSFVAEGAPIPVRQAAFTPITLGLKKMAVIVSYTREIAEHSTPQIEQILRQLIQDDTQIAVDTVLIDATAASAIRPAGLRNGVSATTATAGGGFAALVGDIKALVGVLAAANSLRSPVWIMNPVQAVSIALTQNAGGDFPFAAEIDNNRLQGFPVIVSSTMTAGMVILIDAADFMSVSGDDPRFDVSDQATLHFEDTTPLQLTTGAQGSAVAATPTRSMYQTDSLALRMILPMNWAMRRTGVIAWTQSVTW